MLMIISHILDMIFPPRCFVCKTFVHESFCPNCRSAIEFVNRFENGAFCIAAYKGNMKKAVKALKFRKKKRLGDDLGLILAANLPQTTADIIIPVPLHKSRLKERGFNQSELIAASLSKFRDIPVISNALIRIKQTIPQFELKKHEREENVRGAFEVMNRESIYNKDIILLDDICTTGSTINECKKMLLMSGARSVTAVCLTRAVDV